jgi:hypothetical protein
MCACRQLASMLLSNQLFIAGYQRSAVVAIRNEMGSWPTECYKNLIRSAFHHALQIKSRNSTGIVSDKIYARG